ARVALPGGPVTPSLDLGGDDTYLLLSDGRSLFGALFGGKGLVRFDDDGKRTSLAVMREGVFATTGQSVYGANFDTGAIAQLAPTKRTLAHLRHTTGFAADDHAVYAWSQLDNQLRSIELSTGKVSVLWSPEGFAAADSLVPDGAWLYADPPTDHGSSLVR